MAKDIINDFQWHSSIGISNNFNKHKIIRKLEAHRSNLHKFIRTSSESDFLIHKATKALWKFSDDGTHIEPVCEEDVLNEENL